MKKILSFTVLSIVLVSCSGNDDNNANCNFLLNVGVNEVVNLNFSQYSHLQFVSNSAYIPGVGNNGIIVTNSGTGFLAWDASDPNHSPSPCSAIVISGLEGTCGCDDENTYSLITGQPLGSAPLNCGLKNYRVEQSGNTLLVTN